MNFHRVFRLLASITIVGTLLLPFGAWEMVAPPAASAAFTGVNGPIAFARLVYSNGYQTYRIYKMNADGTNQIALTEGSQPAISPDGSQIAFVRNLFAGGNGIFVINADGTGLRLINTTFTTNERPAWSPDGTKIAFATIGDASPGTPGSWEIYLLNADGTGVPTRVTNNTVNDAEPSWSPDGTKIAFTSNRDYSTGIYVMNADGSNEVRLTAGYNVVSDIEPDWSPDGTKIAFARSIGNDPINSSYDIYVMNADGTNQTRLTNEPLAWDNHPAWSPDGTKIAYYHGGSGAFQVRVIDLANPSAPPTVLTPVGTNVQPSWGVPQAENALPAVSITAPTAGALFRVSDTVTVSASFTDADNNDTHSATIDWDDGLGSVAGLVTETAGSGSGTVSGSKSFTSAGVYTAKVTVIDNHGGQGTATVMLVVYDPAAGFVTGGGWIDSLPGSYTADPTLAGRANFGFVSRYQKGATTPVGQTGFQFDVADFSFYSDSYQWLVVAGPKAQYKGTGAVNGVGGYAFLLTATDGQLPGGGDADKFRIKIWNSSDNTVVYDNVLGVPDDADSANPQAIGAGNIVVHAK